jgi:hypothetical protein
VLSSAALSVLSVFCIGCHLLLAAICRWLQCWLPSAVGCRLLLAALLPRLLQSAALAAACRWLPSAAGCLAL